MTSAPYDVNRPSDSARLGLVASQLFRSEDFHLSLMVTMAMTSFAALLSVGPNPADVWRAQALLETLVYWEPDLSWCLLIDDSPHVRGLSGLPAFQSVKRRNVLSNPRNGAGFGRHGGLFAGLAAGLAWIRDNTSVDFVLKLDTDALVIRSCLSSLGRRLTTHPNAGVAGSIGWSCHPTFRMTRDQTRESCLVRQYRNRPSAQAVARDQWFTPQHSFALSPEQLRRYDAVRPHIEAAMENGFRANEYCQGGAYVVTRAMIDRMAESGYLRDSILWAEIPAAPEDKLMSMYARAVNLSLVDLSLPGEPFGIQGAGLPYPPEELIRSGYSFVHSVKNDKDVDESTIRAFFATHRQKSRRHWHVG